MRYLMYLNGHRQWAEFSEEPTVGMTFADGNSWWKVERVHVPPGGDEDHQKSFHCVPAEAPSFDDA